MILAMEVWFILSFSSSKFQWFFGSGEPAVNIFQPCRNGRKKWDLEGMEKLAMDPMDP